MSGATSHFKAKVVKKTKTGGQLMKECDSVGVVPSDAPRGLDRTYPNGISVCVTDMSTSLEEQNLLFTNDSAQHFLNINVEDLAMNTFEPSFLSSQQTMRSCKNSLTFLSALLSAAGSTPATHFNAHKDPVLGSDFGDTHSLSVVKANTNISSKPELCISTDKNLKRMRKTSAVVSRLSSIERTNPRDKFIERELKTKDEEIDALKGQVSQEQDEKKNLQQRLDSFTRDEADTHFKLARTQEMADKLSGENKAMADCIEKLERNISHMEDRMRNLEIKASEVEKAEISLEVTKRNLESCQIDLKMKERQLEKEKENYEKKCSELTEARTKIKELESKMKDLNVQIRHELMKNENIERGLETIPRLREEIEEKKVKIKSLEKELTEKACLLNSSRKCARELKGKLKDVDTQDEKCQSLKEEMELLQNEVTTLKTLMSSKDVLLQQRCQKLDQAKYAVELLCQTAYSQEEETRLKQIIKLLSKLQQLNLRSISQDDPISPREQSSSWCGQGRSKSAMVRGTHHNQCHDDQQSNKENAVYLDLSDLNYDSSGKRKASKSSSPGSGSLVQRSASFHQITTSRETTQSKEKRVASPNRSRLSDSPYLCSSFRSTSGILYSSSRTPKLSSKFRPSLEYSLGLNGTNEGRNSSSGAKNERPASSIATSRRSQIQISNNLSNGAETDDSNEQANLAPDTLLSKLTRKEKKILSRLSPSQLDSILCYAIQNGDRVSVELDQKPPRYGKKQPKAVKYSGLVKFIGQIDTSSSQIKSTVYVGILLDEPIGDSDGEYKGVRYMFTPPGYAKFCQLRELDTVLDVSLGVYVPINKLVVTRYQDYINTKVDSGHPVSSSSSSSDKIYQPIQV